MEILFSVNRDNLEREESKFKEDVNKNLAEHFKDYLAVMESCKNESFVREIINAYNYLAILNKKSSNVIAVTDIEDYVRNMQILFLFTDKPVKNENEEDDFDRFCDDE